MNYFSIQPNLKIFKHSKFSVFYFHFITNRLALIFTKKEKISLLLFTISILLGIIYILEFNSILILGKKVSVMNADLVKIQNELDKNEAGFSKIYATAISLYLNDNNTLSRVSKIDYVDKKPLAEADKYIP